ncbi:ABC transporter permease [Actinomadura roseirufa]|uniref:ABC transporter permease n=1 Tax=Actinomadura roseirufa TaxID=2094049 RepID=UPI0010412C85|nr:ABC transporter permease [Actinomadura roseirufa]
MNDTIASEWLKLRTVRSTRGLLAAAAAPLVPGTAVAMAMVADWDRASPADRAAFGGADPTPVVVPFAMFCLAALGVLAITSEYGTGMISASLTAVPRRRALLAAKAVVVAAVTVTAGEAVAFASLLAGRLVTGDRPAPIGTTVTVTEAACTGPAMMVAALAGLGLGTLLRSTAGALVAVAAPLFVLPGIAAFLPPGWSEHVSAVLPPDLPAELAGSPGATLPPPAAAAVLIAYAAAALTAAGWALARRDH